MEAFSHSVRISPREREALQLFAEGRKIPEVARAMGIGVRTAYEYLYNVRSKLHAGSTAQAAVLAAQIGLVQVECRMVCARLERDAGALLLLVKEG